MRLVLGVFVCMYAGSLLASLLSRHPAAGQSALLTTIGLGVLSFAFLIASLVLISTPWQLETAIRKLAFTVGCFYAGIFIGIWAQKYAGKAGTATAQISIATFSFHIAVLVLMVRFLREHGTTWSEAFGFRERWGRAVLIGLCAAALFMPVAWGLQGFSSTVVSHLRQFGISDKEQEAVRILRSADSVPDYVKLGIITIVLAPLAEEMLFRGVLYAWLRQIGFPRAALWVSATVFAVVHFNVITFLPLFVLALFLTVLYERTGNLFSSISAHSLFNALNFVLLFLVKDKA